MVRFMSAARAGPSVIPVRYPRIPRSSRFCVNYGEADRLRPGDLPFPGEKGGLLAGSVFRRVWSKARKAVPDGHGYASPVGKRVYDLRHACLATWLNNGVPPAQVAAWAGSGVPVLLATYARCVTGRPAGLQKRIEGPQELPAASPSADRSGRNLGKFSGRNSRQEPSEAGSSRTAAPRRQGS